MITTYGNRSNNVHLTAQALRKGQEVIEDEVADFLLSGLTRATYLSQSRARSIERFMQLSQNINVQKQAHIKFWRALLDAYGPRSAARTCAVPMEFMVAWADYLLDSECPDTKTSDDQAESLLFYWRNDGTSVEAGVHGSSPTTITRLTAAVDRLEMSRSQPQQGTAVSADGGLWGNVRGHWTNTGPR